MSHCFGQERFEMPALGDSREKYRDEIHSQVDDTSLLSSLNEPTDGRATQITMTLYNAIIDTDRDKYSTARSAMGASKTFR